MFEGDAPTRSPYKLPFHTNAPMLGNRFLGTYQLVKHDQKLLPKFYSTMATLAAPLISGRADAAGTSEYAQHNTHKCGQGHFRPLPTQNEACGGDLTVSSLGLGTYLGPETEAADQQYIESITKALSVGINVLDTAVNYRGMRSERAVGCALSEAFKHGAIKREQVVVCSKGGYLTFDAEMRPTDPRKWIQDNYVKAGIFSWTDFVAGCHCMTPAYLKNQVDRSRGNLGLETIDVYYVHNPETQLSEISRETFNTRLREAFEALEEACAVGKISLYGVATWNGFRVSPEKRGHLSLEDLVAAAHYAGGDGHHFRIVQVPYNLSLQEAAIMSTQIVKGKRMSLLSAAQQLGISVVASAALMQASLCKGISQEARSSIMHLDSEATDAQCALQFARTTPGIVTALAGMRTLSHVEENVGVLHYPGGPRRASVA